MGEVLLVTLEVALGLNASCRGIDFLGDFNINLFVNGNIILINPPVIKRTQIYSLKNYHEYCALFGLKQLIKCPTHVSCNSSSIIDHVLASFSDRFSKSGVIDVGILDHQLIYCTRNLQELKAATINKLLSVLLKIIHLRLTKRL